MRSRRSYLLRGESACQVREGATPKSEASVRRSKESTKEGGNRKHERDNEGEEEEGITMLRSGVGGGGGDRRWSSRPSRAGLGFG